MIRVFLLMWACFALPSFSYQLLEHQAPEAATASDIQTLFKDRFSQQLMYFNLKSLPLKIEASDKRAVKEMDPFLKQELVTRRKVKLRVEKVLYGAKRVLEALGYEYTLNPDSPWVSEQGLYYGRPTLKAIKDVSAPQFVKNDFFSEVYLTWYVSDHPGWVKSVDLRSRQNRPLRRALESEQKPFEARIYLVYRGKRWQLWEDEGKQSLMR